MGVLTTWGYTYLSGVREREICLDADIMRFECVNMRERERERRRYDKIVTKHEGESESENERGRVGVCVHLSL